MMMQETENSSFAVYIMANGIMTFHIAITNKLQQMVEAHKTNADPHAFTTRFSLHNLVYYELYTTQNSARNREIQLKAMPKQELIATISKMNPSLGDMFERFLAGDTPMIQDKEPGGKKRTRRKKAYPAAHVVSLRSLSRAGGSD